MWLFAATELFAEFARYADRDPLCCPSATSRVTYRIIGGAAPALEPAAVVTAPRPTGP